MFPFRFCLLLFLSYGTAALLRAQPQAHFDPAANRWTLSNGWIEAAFLLKPSGGFVLDKIADVRSGDVWEAPDDRVSSVFRLRSGTTWFDGSTAMRLASQSTQAVAPDGIRLTIVLEDRKGQGRLEVGLEMYDGQPVLRYDARFTNLRPQTVHVNWVSMVPWAFADEGKRYTAFRVNQWVTDLRPSDFTPLETVLDPGGKAVEVYSGAHGAAVQLAGGARRGRPRALLIGWEFDGRARTTVRHYGAEGYLQFSSNVLDLNHPVEPNDVFEAPAAFIGPFPRRLGRSRLPHAAVRRGRAGQARAGRREFPVRGLGFLGVRAGPRRGHAAPQSAEAAARLGVELFTVDLGWARAIGDWHDDPAKFPSGLRALSDYVHSLGMKFGLHFALAEAAPDSPVLRRIPTGPPRRTTTTTAPTRCASPTGPTREWMIRRSACG